MNFEYKFIHTYEDRFSKRFGRAINFSKKGLKSFLKHTQLSTKILEQDLRHFSTQFFSQQER